MKIAIFEKRAEEFAEEIFATLGKGKQQARAIYRSFMKTGSVNSELPVFSNCKALYHAIIENTDCSLPEMVLQLNDQSTTKFLLKTHDGHKIESVVIPMKRSDTLCVSSQIGCRMGCTFCETGRNGLVRSLTAGEIVTQLFIARHILKKEIRNVVFMGMGEPFDNYDEVLHAAKIISDQHGFNIGMSKITISTSGKIEGIKRLAQEPHAPNLAVSINAPIDALRTKLMPHNRKENLQALHNAMRDYITTTGKKILIAYVLIQGINDSQEKAEQLAHYLQGLPVKVNLIPYNSTSIGWKSTEDADIQLFRSILEQRSLQVLCRKTKGSKVAAACGQLSFRK